MTIDDNVYEVMFEDSLHKVVDADVYEEQKALRKKAEALNEALKQTTVNKHRHELLKEKLEKIADEVSLAKGRGEQISPARIELILTKVRE